MAAENIESPVNTSLLHLNIKTLNTQGFKSNATHVSSLIEQTDILFLSEHWLSNAEKSILNNITHSTHKIFFTPAEKQAAGRPYGGNCFLIRDQLADEQIVIHDDKNILAIQLKSQTFNLVVIGVYLTCYHDASSKEDYTQQLNNITSIIEMYVDESDFIIMGDFQTFPSNVYDHLPRNNVKRNPLSPLLGNFLAENDLDLVDITVGEGPTYTYEHKTLKNQSYIDHIAIIKDSRMHIERCATHEICSDNISDHQAIELHVQIEHIPNLSSIINNETSNIVPKSVWKNPDFQSNYRTEVGLRIEEMIIDSCSDPEKLILNVQEIMFASGLAAFKATYHGKSAPPFSKEWWTPQLTASKKILATHFNVWRDQGFPKDTDNVFFNRYTLARKNFRCAVKAAQNKMIAEKYIKINSLKRTDPRKFWANMRNLKESQKRSFNINNKQTDEDITREFGDHFNTLLNNPKGKAVPITRDLPECSSEIFTTCSEDVKDAISKLKEYKSNDYFGLVAEHFIHADNEQLPSLVSLIFNKTFEQDNAPTPLGCSTLIPLVKSYRKSLKSSNNYRGISLIPILLKIMEYVILKKCPALTENHSSQFGFKTKSSTLHAEFLISETINHYNKNGSSVYMCSLDAEKAFDSCNWSVLFEKLYYEKNIPLPVVKFLKSLYENGKYSVMYNGQRSYWFDASQGVFQGSILSPHLYNIYTEQLLKIVGEQNTAGTSVYGTFTGILAYADDIILLSPTRSGLQQLLSKCTSYFNKTAISLNVGKTEFLVSSSKAPTSTYIELNHHLIQCQDKLKHLGFMWSKKKNGDATLNQLNVQERTNKFWALIHSLIKGGIRFCHPYSIVELYRTLAVPILTYGLELTHLCQTEMNNLDTEGRKALKFLFNLSPYSKNYLNDYFHIKPISNTVNNNKINLLSRLMNNASTSNVILRTLQSTTPRYNSLVWDCYAITQKNELNFFDLLLNNKKVQVNPCYTQLSEETASSLKNCFQFWNVGKQRKVFKDLMEDRVIRND